MSILTNIKNIFSNEKNEDIKNVELEMIHELSTLIGELHEIIALSIYDEPEESEKIDNAPEMVECTKKPLVVKWIPPDLTLSPHAVHEGRIEPKVEPENVENSPSPIVHSLTELNKKGELNG